MSIEGDLSVLVVSLDSSKKRNHLHRCFIQAKYGVLGHDIHVHIPVCVLDSIHTICPSTDSSYTNLCKIGDNDKFEDADDDSDEDADIKLGPSEK